MDQCPNCGNQIRTAAKFCTSCGFRLAERPIPYAAPVIQKQSPFATTASPSPSPSPVVEPVIVSVTEKSIEPTPPPQRLATPPVTVDRNALEYQFFPSPSVATAEGKRTGELAPIETSVTVQQVMTPLIIESVESRNPDPLSASELELAMSRLPQAARHRPSEQLGIQATHLMEELYAVIDALVVGGPVASAPLTATTANLRKAIAESRRNDDALKDLRKALANVRRRRQNVDSMVELMNHLDAMVELQKAHDSLLLASEKLLFQLTETSSVTKARNRSTRQAKKPTD